MGNARNGDRAPLLPQGSRSLPSRMNPPRPGQSDADRSRQKPDPYRSTHRLPAVGFAEEGQSAEPEKENGGKNVNSADLVGIADQVGSLESDKSADLIARQRDFLSDVTVLKNRLRYEKKGKLTKRRNSKSVAESTLFSVVLNLD